MEKIWLKHYPAGVPADINPDHYQSLADLFEEGCRKFNDRPSFCNLGVSLSFQELDEQSKAFAAYLQQELKLKKGDRLAIMLPNVLQYPVVLFAALRLGVIVVNVNPLYTVPELIHQLADAGAETIVVLENFADTVEKALPRTSISKVILARVGDIFPWWKGLAVDFVLKYVQRQIPAWNIPGVLYYKEILKKGRALNFQPVTLDREDIAFLQYTGGTTGLAKGAMLTHRNLLANIEQGYAWFKSQFQPGKETVLTALPLYHIFSLTVNCLLYATKVGGTNVLITNPRKMAQMMKEMSKYQFTCITGVNTLFNGMVKSPDFAKLDFSKLGLTVGGGTAVQQAVADQWKAITGTVLLEGYGLTEASPCVTANPADLKAYHGSIGFPLPSTDICILDDEGKEVELGKAGELAVKGPQIMKGYWNQPEETKNTFTADGWLLTGDIARVDEEGFVYILERKKDMILVSGFNVYPSEVEGVIASMPGVAEVAVVGVRDAGSGEAVKAFIVKSDPSLMAEQVLAYCHQSLTGYKIPKFLEFCKDLPKSNVGKILRRALKEKA